MTDPLISSGDAYKIPESLSLFVGVAPGSPWQVYLLLAIPLFVLAALVLYWQLKDPS